MKIVLLGNEGMLGHVLARTLRDAGHQLHDGGRKFDVFSCIRDWCPDVVINCAGIVKQRTDVDAEEFIRTNALLPHQLFKAARNVGARLIHFSTDCVFSGDHGAYNEDHRPDPVDLYGRSKLLGEVNEEGCLTVRTSIIGRELRKPGRGLVEWLLEPAMLKLGYACSYFSGLTTLELARVVEHCITERPTLSGIWHVSGEAISKMDLLEKLVIAYGLPTRIVPDHTVMCNRVLRSDEFRKRIDWRPPSWTEMVIELAKEQPL